MFISIQQHIPQAFSVCVEAVGGKESVGCEREDRVRGKDVCLREKKTERERKRAESFVQSVLSRKLKASHMETHTKRSFLAVAHSRSLGRSAQRMHLFKFCFGKPVTKLSWWRMLLGWEVLCVLPAVELFWMEQKLAASFGEIFSLCFNLLWSLLFFWDLSGLKVENQENLKLWSLSLEKSCKFTYSYGHF